MSFLEGIFGSKQSDTQSLTDNVLHSEQVNAIRDKVIASAGPVLGPSVAAVLDDDDRYHLSCTGSDVLILQKRQPLAALAKLSPDERGRVFEHLVALLDNPRQFGIAKWGELQVKKPYGCPHCDLDFPRGFKTLIAALASHRMELVNADKAMAAFLRLQPQTSGRCRSHKRILKPLLQTIEAYPSGETVKELRTVKELPYVPQLIYDNRIRIEEVLRNLPAPSIAPMAPTAQDCDGEGVLARRTGRFGRKGSDSATSKSAASNEAPFLCALPPIALPAFKITSDYETRKISDHFDNLFEARLYDGPHLDFLYRLAVIGAKIGGHTVNEPGLEKLAREAILGSGFSDGCLDELSGDDFGWAMHALADSSVTATALFIRFKAFEPFVRDNPERMRTLATLAGQLVINSVPSKKWRDRAAGVFNRVSQDKRFAMLDAALSGVSPTSADPANETHLRTLICLADDLDPQILGPKLVQYALKQCYVTLPGIGIRAEKLGNACIRTLTALPDGAGVPYLARILARVKYPKIRGKIDAALNEAAERAGVTRAALDELTVPTHDLDAQGEVAFDLNGGRAVVALSGNKDVDIRWLSPDGKSLKAPSAAMKEDKEIIKAAKNLAKEIEADLATQIIRLQRLFLDDRSWPVDEWRARYLEHPLLRSLAQRLIWWVEMDGKRVSTIAHDGRLADVAGTFVDAEAATIRLWHPIEDSVDAVMQWRDRIETLQIVQPFAQAWREIYRLTDAERTTGTYTNRWSGHILKQHQAMTLARLSNWTVTHRMWVDAPNDAPWHVVLPAHGLVADYWVEGAGGDDPETLDSGAYVYVSTDRVVFHRIAEHHSGKDSAHGPDRAVAVPLEDIAPVVFSEIMRHGDLFTGVASIASDPQWLDGGGDAAHPNQWRRDAAQYWTRASFADLTGAGQIRREMLERVIPKLAIAPICSFDENALVVNGKRHVYRIHLGSAAVQIASRSQHICIVPAGRTADAAAGIWLPFEGDRTLSLILSKAILLAADDKITDPVILRQI